MAGAATITARPRPTPTTGPRLFLDDDSLDGVLDEALVAPTWPFSQGPRRGATPPPIPSESRKTANLRVVPLGAPAGAMAQWSMPPEVAQQQPSDPQAVITARSVVVAVRRGLFGASVLRGLATFLTGATVMLLLHRLTTSGPMPAPLPPYVIHVTSAPAAPIVTPLTPIETTCPVAESQPAGPARVRKAAVRQHAPQNHPRARSRDSDASWVDPFAD